MWLVQLWCVLHAAAASRGITHSSTRPAYSQPLLTFPEALCGYVTDCADLASYQFRNL